MKGYGDRFGGRMLLTLPRARQRSGLKMEVVFWVPFSTYGMVYTVACHFLKFRAINSSRSKAEMKFEGGSDFMDAVTDLKDVLYDDRSVPKICHL